jgi:hypothetical protein
MDTQTKIFKQRLDFYGQSLAVYVLVLVIFLIFHGTIQGGEFTFSMFSPLVVLMSAIIAITIIMLIIATVKRKQVIIDDETITIKSRIYEKTFSYNDIRWIKITRSPSSAVKRQASFVRIKFKGRKKSILIRTASFYNEIELLDCLSDIKRKVTHSSHHKHNKHITRKY